MIHEGRATVTLMDEMTRLYDEYMDEENDDLADPAMHYVELHPKTVAVLEAAQALVERYTETVPENLHTGVAALVAALEG